MRTWDGNICENCETLDGYMKGKDEEQDKAIGLIHSRIDKHMSREEKLFAGLFFLFLSFVGVWYYDSVKKDEQISDIKVQMAKMPMDIVKELRSNWDFVPGKEDKK